MFYENVVQFIENVLNPVHCTVYTECIYICDAWNNYVSFVFLHYGAGYDKNSMYDVIHIYIYI